MKRRFVFRSFLIVMFVAVFCSIVYASDSGTYEKVSVVAANGDALQRMGQGTSFIGALYTGAKMGSSCSSVDPWRAFGMSNVTAYVKFFQKYSGANSAFVIVTDNGGFVVAMKSLSSNLDAGVYDICPVFDLPVGQYSLSVVMTVPDGILISNDSYSFVVN